MKTRNEQIAERMGWEIQSDGIICDVAGFNIGIENSIELAISLAKLIQAQLVEEGWDINIISWQTYNADPFFLITADHHFPGQKRFNYFNQSNCPVTVYSEANTEPAAIVALACKVWGIE